MFRLLFVLAFLAGVAYVGLSLTACAVGFYAGCTP